MNIESKINVHQSSLVGLKAELLRKKNEVEEAKANQQNVDYLNKQRERIKKKTQKELKKEEKKKKKEELEARDEDPETMRAHKKSKLMLQAKSRLYAKLSKTHTTINPNFLVDFENKPYWSDHSDDEDRSKNDKNKSNDDDDYYKSDDSDSEWVEYTDCFGRSRKCLRDDLPKMREEDEKLKKTIAKEPKEDAKDREVQFFEDREPMKEPTIEVMRRKWEEQTAKLANKDDIHYQDILFDEARAHGVGYFAFSQDEEERAKQQESLAKLRKETEQKQQENQRILEMKEKIQQNRLKAARVRQRLRAGLPPDDPEDEKIEDNEASKTKDIKKEEASAENVETEKEDSEEISEKKANIEESKQEVARKKLIDIEKKVKAFGELLGKRNKWYVMSQEEWVQKKRKERDNEFAPVYENFEHGETLNISEPFEESTNSSRSGNEESFIKSIPEILDDDNLIGPMPPLSDGDDYIGPVPPPSVCKDFIGLVPPPSVCDDLIGPVPLPTLTKVLENPKESASNVNIEDQVAAGLKFLRQQFESRHIS